jgi:anti-sigma B factor antagonist
VNNEGIWVHHQPGKLWLKIIGRGSFQNAHFLKDILADAIEHHETVTHTCIDLTDCSGLDSTFLGAIAGLALQMKKNSGSTTISGATGRNRELLENMGLSLLINIKSEDDEPCKIPMVKAQKQLADKESAAVTMLEAHETLANLSESNNAQFQNVIDYLRRRALKQTTA